MLQSRFSMRSNPPHLRVRLATAADMDAMIAIVNAAFSIETFLDGPRTDEQRISAMMSKGEFLLAEDAGNVVACVYVEQRGERGYFGMLAVDPTRQNQGLGRVMVAAAEKYCRERGCGQVEIDVLSLRTELPPFYQRLGYVKTGMQEFHPSRPLKPGVACHCIIMSKQL